MEGGSGEDFAVEEAFASTESPRPERPWFYGEERKVKVAAIYEQGEEEQEIWEIWREMGAGRGELP